MNPRILLTRILLIAGLTAGASATAGDPGSEPSTHGRTTASGHVVDVERTLIEGEAGGRAVRRDVTVSDADGSVVGEGRNVRYRTADGAVGHVDARRVTGEDGRTRTGTRAVRRDAEGDVSARRAVTGRDVEGEPVHRRVDRARRDADGGGARVTRRAHAGEDGVRAQRRVVRGDGQGNRSVRTQRIRRPGH